MTRHQYTGQLISTALYIRLEHKRHIENTETPGKYGYFTADDSTAGDAE